MKVKLRAQYDDHTAISDETGLECLDETRTQQHQKEECDINNIVRRYIQTGEAPQHQLPPLADDFQMVESMQDAMQLIVDARMAFMQQPAEVRARFQNKPEDFVAFCSDENNRGDMLKMGLLNEAAVMRFNEEQARIAAEIAANKRDAEEYRKGSQTPKS